MTRFLFIGAHPDDPDVSFGGSALKLLRAGHVLKFVSVTNGDRGHHLMPAAELAERRFAEAQKAAKFAGLAEYQILNHHDCELEPTAEIRQEIIRLIRDFAPDVVISHRTCDYHADHRATAQLVMDSAYLIRVPSFCSDTPIPEQNPVYAVSYDRFQNPRPIRADAAVEIDSVFEDKCRLLDCHVSQFYEWIPWNLGAHHINAETMTWQEKKEWLQLRWFQRFEEAANTARETLRQTLGKENGEKVRYAEIFEQTEYGKQVTLTEFRECFQV